MSHRELVAVDVDDVITASAPGWVAYSNKTWGTHLTVDDYDEDWAKMWQVDFETARQRAHQIHADPSIIAGFIPDLEALIALREIKKRRDLVITTSRVRSHEAETIKWLDRHYTGIFNDIYLTDFYKPGNVSREAEQMTKADLIARIGADYLIDDQLKHCRSVAAIGRQAILFGDYGWNQLAIMPPNMTRCVDWPAVQHYFNALNRSTI